MPPKYDEFDVFKIPHSRMMQLVNTCNEKLVVTDFANNDALFALLSNLHCVFKEFKSHEEIENEHIMTKLSSKLKALAIYNSAVCNCHKDDEFTPLLDLVEKGYLFINKAKTTSERISFGVKLRKALSQFTKRFVPHMKEEEEVFQPLLMKYFSQEELVEMKNIVIKSHMQQRKSSSNGGQTSFSSSSGTAPFSTSSSRLNEKDSNDSFNHLPNEILFKIFSYLDYPNMFKAAKVSKKWNNLVYDKTNWRKLELNDWKRNKSSVVNGNEPNLVNDDDNDDEDDEEIYQLNKNYKPQIGYKDIEYIDDSDEEYDDESEIQAQEVKMLQFWIKNLLPRVGTYINELNLSKCKSLNNNLARRILQLCPNLTKLNLSYTNIGDNAFRGVYLDRLTHFNCEGCEKLSDNAFKYLLISANFRNSIQLDCSNSKRQQQISQNETKVSQIETNSNENKILNNKNEIESDNQESNSYCDDCTKKYSIEELHSISRNTNSNNNFELNNNNNNNNSNNNNKHEMSHTESANLNVDNTNKFINENSLRYINLSGCWLLTDYGLSCLATKYNLEHLQYLNLSGCINLSSFAMNLFVEMSNMLNGENLYYCDNIEDGPLKATANGCENLECSNKFCCRTGQ